MQAKRIKQLRFIVTMIALVLYIKVLYQMHLGESSGHTPEAMIAIVCTIISALLARKLKKIGVYR